MMIRDTRREDMPGLARVLEETDLFPSDMLPELAGAFLSGEGSNDLWLTCELDGSPVGFCYAVPEPLAEGTWNMLAIGVLQGQQGNGSGAALVAELETRLKACGQRVLIADTSGTDEFERTREFYRKRGYAEEARIRDFWGPGDDKVTFWKSLA